MSRSRATLSHFLSALMMLAALALAAHVGPALADRTAGATQVAAMSGHDHARHDAVAAPDAPTRGEAQHTPAPCKSACCGPGSGCMAAAPAVAASLPAPARGRLASLGFPTHDGPRTGFDPPGLGRPPNRLRHA